MSRLNPYSLPLAERSVREKRVADVLYSLAISERGGNFGSTALASDAWGW